MYANYSGSEVKNEFDLRAFQLKAYGIDSSSGSCADLLNKPTNYYNALGTSNEGIIDCLTRVKFQNTSGATAEVNNDPRVRAALAHSIIIEEVSGLIEENDIKFLSYICYAIVRSDVDALKKLLNGVARSIPQKLQAYVSTLNQIFSNLETGICFTFHGRNMILLHIYHNDLAIAIDPIASGVSVVPIFTDWDGTVFFAEADPTAPAADDLLEAIQAQCITRVLMRYADYDQYVAASSLTVVHEEKAPELELTLLPELLTVAMDEMAA